jgi:Phosphotransferase enzyme family
MLQNRLADGRRCAGRRIVNIARRRSPYSSTFAIDEIDVQFAGSRAPLMLVMKDLGTRAISASARESGSEFLYDPRREIEAYRHILPHAPPGTAICYGAVCDDARRTYRLFLERVEGFELRHIGDFAIWERAAGWIAAFHRAFAPHLVEELVQKSRVLVYDEAFYWRWLERARRFTPARSVARKALDRIARGYVAVVRRLVSLPRTVIHGEFYPCNVLIRSTGDQVRICPIDWEMAGYGPGLIDLAALTTGWNLPQQRALMRAYREQTSQFAVKGTRIPSDFVADLNCCRLHLAIRMLGWAHRWTPPPHQARDWLADAEFAANRLPYYR